MAHPRLGTGGLRDPSDRCLSARRRLDGVEVVETTGKSHVVNKWIGGGTDIAVSRTKSRPI